MKQNLENLAKMIDHSLLHPTLTDREMEEGCRLAVRYDVASVCIKPYALADAVKWLEGSDVKAGTVIGFPHGNSAIEIKCAEAEQACLEGAAEIDMVINIGKALGGDWRYISEEIDLVNRKTVEGGAILKVIFENDFLAERHMEKLCRICNEINPAFIKTSTGYGFTRQENGDYNYKGAVVSHLRLMRKTAAEGIGIKAAGGIKTLDDLLSVRTIGVTRVGATATAGILDEARIRLERGEIF